MHSYVSIFFQILFPYRLLQNVEYNFLCYTVGLRWLSILLIVCIYINPMCVCVLVAQLCLTLCNTMDCSSPGSSVEFSR